MIICLGMLYVLCTCHNYISSWKTILEFSATFRASWLHAGSLKFAMAYLHDEKSTRPTNQVFTLTSCFCIQEIECIEVRTKEGGGYLQSLTRRASLRHVYTVSVECGGMFCFSWECGGNRLFLQGSLRVLLNLYLHLLSGTFSPNSKESIFLSKLSLKLPQYNRDREDCAWN